MAERWWRRLFLVLGALTLAVLFLGLPWQPARAEGATREVTIDMEARQWAYSPGTIEVNRGDRVRIRLVSTDVTHGFYLDGYGIQQQVDAGIPATIEFVAGRAGRWMFRCSETCGSFHPYMIGWLRVKPNYYAGAGWTLVTLSGIGFVAYFGYLGVKPS